MVYILNRAVILQRDDSLLLEVLLNVSKGRSDFTAADSMALLQIKEIYF